MRAMRRAADGGGRSAADLGTPAGLRALAATMLLTAALLAAVPPTAAEARPIVVFLSDFGTGNEAVAICHGAMLAIDTEIEIVDLTHAIPPFDVRFAAATLARATTFPAGTVFVAVVDPGVGTERRALALRTRDGSFFVGPDNGIFTEVVRRRGAAEVVRVEPRVVNPDWQPGTFDGRDLFAPAAARLATGRYLVGLGAHIDSAAIVLLAPEAGGIVQGPGLVAGKYTQTDEPYGNVWTDISRETLRQARIEEHAQLDVEIGGERLSLPLVVAFGDVPEGKPLAYFNSEDRLAFAINLGSLRDSLRVAVGSPVLVRLVRPPAPGRNAPPGEASPEPSKRPR
jgi:S-adenosylmethionine hydrolase